jgi:amidase
MFIIDKGRRDDEAPPMKFQPPSAELLRKLGERLGLSVSAEESAAYARCAAELAGPLQRLDALAEWLPKREFPRDPARDPTSAENPFKAWASLLRVEGCPDGKLRGKRIALKDTICLAGATLRDGTQFLDGALSEFDATVATRLLLAGGTILGKAVCEFMSYSSGSHTSLSGAVENPRKRGYSTGGSSSGCAALVAAGEVDIAIGGDQAGSIRIPSAHCGIYGMKPTWGLVPYSGAVSSDYNVDHLGPMTATVADNALALEAIAGADGLDSRATSPPPSKHDYAGSLDLGLAGLRIGLVSEGFAHRTSMPQVDRSVRAAAAKLERLGARVTEISIPWHRDGMAIWLGVALEGYHRNLMLGGGFGGNNGALHWTGLQQQIAGWRDHTEELPHNLRLGMLMGEYLGERYHGGYYARSMNLVRPLGAAYDAALAEHDLLAMPTVPRSARPLAPRPATPEAIIEEAFENIENTSPFNLTHHPALSMPCGMADNGPVGIMLVARRHGEATIYRAAAAFEAKVDWRSP